MSHLELEEAEKIFSSPFKTIKPFGTFAKSVEEKVDIAEAAKCPCTPAQVASKSLNCILRAQSLQDEETREWKHKVPTDKTCTKLKTHLSREIR